MPTKKLESWPDEVTDRRLAQALAAYRLCFDARRDGTDRPLLTRFELETPAVDALVVYLPRGELAAAVLDRVEQLATELLLAATRPGRVEEIIREY